MNSRPLFRLSALCVALAFVTGSSLAQGQAASFDAARHADVVRTEGGRVLTAPGAVATGQLVAGMLRSRGRDSATLATLRQLDSRTSRAGATHLRF